MVVMYLRVKTLVNSQGGAVHEKNISAQEKTEKQRTRFQKKNGYSKR